MSIISKVNDKLNDNPQLSFESQKIVMKFRLSVNEVSFSVKSLTKHNSVAYTWRDNNGHIMDYRVVKVVFNCEMS